MSALKSASCSCHGSGFDSQHLVTSLQQSVTPVTGDLMPFSGSMGTAYMWFYRHAPLQNTHMHKAKLKKSTFEPIFSVLS